MVIVILVFKTTDFSPVIRGRNDVFSLVDWR